MQYYIFSYYQYDIQILSHTFPFIKITGKSLIIKIKVDDAVIQTDLYKIHIDKNLCNPLKINMSRCPFCHHDIEKDQQGFYQHLVVDGCAYQNNM